jgi:hypothetical protein
LTAALCTALLAGCGGSGLGRADLASKANVICGRTDKVLRHLPPPGFNVKDQALWLAKVVRAREREWQALKNLTPSSDVKPAFYRYLDNDANVIAALTTARARARGGDASGVAAVLNFDTGSSGRMRSAARHLGWRRCGRYL